MNGYYTRKKRELVALTVAVSAANHLNYKPARDHLPMAVSDIQAAWGCYFRLTSALAVLQGHRVARADRELAEKVAANYRAARNVDTGALLS